MSRKHRNLHQISVELKPDTISLADESASWSAFVNAAMPPSFLTLARRFCI
jgi:hypothetical protein